MYKELDPLLHSQLRLAIISMLVMSKKVEFTHIKEQTKAASGNISIQVKKMQEAGYIEVEKSFKNNYPKTMMSITAKGLKAFEDYVNDLKKYISPK